MSFAWGEKIQITNTYPNTENIPTYVSASCIATDGLLYIDTVEVFSRPQPSTLPSCAFGYDFASIYNTEIYYTALSIGRQCMDEGSSMWVSFAGTSTDVDGLGYQIIVALYSPTIPKAINLAEIRPTLPPNGPHHRLEKYPPLYNTLYTPLLPFVCLNENWVDYYAAKWNPRPVEFTLPTCPVDSGNKEKK